MITEKLNTLLIGSTGITASAVAPEIVANTDVSDPNIINIIVQLIVGIATLIKLFKKEKKV